MQHRCTCVPIVKPTCNPGPRCYPCSGFSGGTGAVKFSAKVKLAVFTWASANNLITPVSEIVGGRSPNPFRVRLRLILFVAVFAAGVEFGCVEEFSP